jgi:hypothetical protein
MSKRNELIVVVRCPVCRVTVCNGGFVHQRGPGDKRERFNTITEFGLEGLRQEREQIEQKELV